MSAAAEPEMIGSNRLPVLASSINEHLAAAEAATKRGLEHALAAGLLLIEAKELVHHGQWLNWLQANCQIGQRQAQTYMRLARNRHRLDTIKNAATSHLTIAAAEALVGRPRPERPHGLPGQFDMLGGPEVTAPATSPRCDRLALITGLELAFAVIKELERDAQVTAQFLNTKTLQSNKPKQLRHLEQRAKNAGKQLSRLRAANSTIDAALAYLREQWRARR